MDLINKVILLLIALGTFPGNCAGDGLRVIPDLEETTHQSTSDHFGVGFSTKYISKKPDRDQVINHILPDLKNTLGITNFRIYNAIEDAPYVADLIKGNNNVKFIIDVGFIWYRDWEAIPFDKLTADDVGRYLTDFINEVGKAVQELNGSKYEWLDNVKAVAYFNEPIIEWEHWFREQYPTMAGYSKALIRLNGFVQDFFNTYKDGKYMASITVAPIFIGGVIPGLTAPLIEASVDLQVKAGAQAGVYANLYACHPTVYDPASLPDGNMTFMELTACIGLPGVGASMGYGFDSQLDANVYEWEEFIHKTLPNVDPDDVKFTITETGWPTGGISFASEYVSAQFYSSTIRQMMDPESRLSGVDVYFFEALDEDIKPGPETEKHWGLMTSNGKIKEQILQYWPVSAGVDDSEDGVHPYFDNMRSETE